MCLALTTVSVLVVSPTESMKVDDKIAAREWIIGAIQNYQVAPNKGTEHEIRRFIKRLQRDLKQLRRARETLEIREKYSKEARRRGVQFEHAVNK